MVLYNKLADTLVTANAMKRQRKFKGDSTQAKHMKLVPRNDTMISKLLSSLERDTEEEEKKQQWYFIWYIFCCRSQKKQLKETRTKKYEKKKKESNMQGILL